MRNRFLFFWREFQSSFWFIPLLILLGTIIAATLLVYLDQQLDITPEGLLFFFVTGSTDSARSILSTIAGAMIGVAGTVFSITLVALTLASSQFGPRLLRNFMEDKLNQVVLGTYVSTFIFCLLVLRTVKSGGEFHFVPNLSVLFAIILALANILLLILFIHHISVSIQADSVIADISKSVSRSVRNLFPEDIGEEKHPPEIPAPEELESEFPLNGEVQSDESGYLQSVDTDSLLNLATRHNLVLTVDYRPGDFVIANSRILSFRAREEWEESLPGRLESAFIYGKMRTSSQDAEFPIHQMVEIAARALSPGVNDPYTAISCIDHLTATIAYLTRAQFPSPFRYDENGKLRVITSALTFTGMIDAAYNQIRQFARGNPAVLIRLMDSLIILRTHTNSTEQLNAIERHAAMVLRAGKDSLTEQEDRADLEDRYLPFASENEKQTD